MTDDYGNTFRRGIATSLNVHDWQALARTSAAQAFLFLEPSGSKVEASSAKRPVPTPAGAT